MTPSLRRQTSHISCSTRYGAVAALAEWKGATGAATAAEPFGRTIHSHVLALAWPIPSVWQAQQLELWRSTMVKDAHGAGKGSLASLFTSRVVLV
jgi:hypothetical protein